MPSLEQQADAVSLVRTGRAGRCGARDQSTTLDGRRLAAVRSGPAVPGVRRAP